MASDRHTPGAARSGSDSSSGLLPGMVLGVLGLAGAVLLAEVSGVASPLVLAVGLGMVVANAGAVPPATLPGLRFVARCGLRAGVVLLGFRLAVGDIVAMGLRGLAAVVTVVALTFVGTRWLARKLRLSDELGLLVATGFSICGVTAIAAMEGVSEADEEDVAVAAALVTLCGTLAIVALPLLGARLGLEPELYGAWAGASVHDVAQVVAAASPFGADAVTGAVTVKLSRVVLLAPLVAAVGVARHRARVGGLPPDSGGTEGTGSVSRVVAGRSARWSLPVPLFVVGFLMCAAVRSTGQVPDLVLDGARTVEGFLLAAAMFAVGTGVRLARLRRVGARPVVLGLLSWGLVASASLVATWLAFS